MPAAWSGRTPSSLHRTYPKVSPDLGWPPEDPVQDLPASPQTPSDGKVCEMVTPFPFAQMRRITTITSRLIRSSPCTAACSRLAIPKGADADSWPSVHKRSGSPSLRTRCAGRVTSGGARGRRPEGPAAPQPRPRGGPRPLRPSAHAPPRPLPQLHLLRPRDLSRKPRKRRTTAVMRQMSSGAKRRTREKPRHRPRPTHTAAGALAQTRCLSCSAAPAPAAL